MERAELFLVDASLGQRAVLQRMLTAHGFSVVACPGLQKSVPRVATQRFDYAVLDLRVSDRGGLGLIRSLREARPQIPLERKAPKAPPKIASPTRTSQVFPNNFKARDILIK